ncbi:MAG: AsmA family protein, partial [Bacteroidia bacterium]|nr:AsmA family protein [Bacteroidia bacterium]
MKKFLKITGITLLVLIIFLAAAPFLFKGKILNLIRTEANKNLNATVNFSDDISLGIFRSFPNLSLGLNNVSVVGKDTFNGDTLVYLPELRATLNLMSVIKGDKIEIRSIYMKDPIINLLVLKNGKANWDIAKADSTKPADPADTASKFKLGLEKLQIDNGNLVYDDQSMPFYTALRNFDHTLKGDFTQDVFLLETKTVAQKMTIGYGGIEYLHNVMTDIKADIDMDMKNMKFTFRDNIFILNQLNLAADGFLDLNGDNMDMDMKFAAKKTEFKNILSLVPAVFTKDYDKAKISGKMAFDGFVKGTMTETTIPGFGINLMVENGFFQYPDLPKSLSDVNLKLNVINKGNTVDNTVVDLSRFHMVMAGEPFDARLLVKTPTSNMYLDGAVKGKVMLDEFRNMMPLDAGTKLSGLINADVNFKGYMSAIEKGQYENFNAAGTLGINDLIYSDPVSLPQGMKISEMALNFNPATVKMPVLKGTIGMSDFATNGEVNNIFGYMLKDQTLQGNLNLNSNYFNINEFLSDDKAKETPAAADTVKMQAFEVPANIDFVINTAVKKMIYDNLVMNDFMGNVTLRNQQLLLNNVETNLLGGNIIMNGAYDARNPKFPFSDLDLKITKMDIAKTFEYFNTVKTLLPIAQYTTGLLSANINLSNNYNNDLSVAYPTVNGLMGISIGDAAINDFKILNIIAEKLKMPRLKNLALKDLKFRLQLDKGKVILDSMILPMWQGAKAKITGYSSLDKSINYIAKLTIPRKDFGAANTALEGLFSQAKA